MLVLKGDLGIRHAAQIKKKLETVKFSAEQVSIQMKEVENLDLTVIQMIYSLAGSLEKEGKKTELSMNTGEEMAKLLSRSGFREIKITA